MVLYRLAYKNFLRYKKRSLITAAAIAIGIMVYIVMDSLVVGSMDMSELNLHRYEMGQGSIMTQQAWEDRDNMPLDKSITDSKGVMALLEGFDIPHSRQISFQADMIVYYDPFPEDGSLPVVVRGIDLMDSQPVLDLEETLYKGEWLKPGDDGVVLGQWLAHDLGADLGFPITLKTRTKDGYFQVLELELVGIIDCPSPLVNREGVYISLESADYLLEMEGAVTDILLAKKMEQNEAESLPAGILFYTWEEMASDYISMSSADRYSSMIILFLVFIIAAVGVSNTMLMSVMERHHELGMMRAMGMTEKEIKALFLFEAAYIGLAGSLMGILGGALANLPFVLKGFALNPSFDSLNFGYRISGQLWGVWNFSTFFLAFISGILLSVIISQLTLHSILKKTITEELSYA